MNMGQRTSCRAKKRRHRALSMVEAVVSIIIVGVALVAALQVAAMSKSALRIRAERLQGRVLAEQLMQEILAQAYVDPQGADPMCGPSAAELVPGNRSLFDDVDDYCGWSESPPQYKTPQGQPSSITMPNLTGWERSARSDWLLAPAMSVSASDTGIKRLTVTVKFRGRVVAESVALRCGKPAA
jgi:type II secretory pathway pseudopilin PulG